MNEFKHGVSNAIFWVLTYYALVEKIDGALNVITFAVVILFLLAAFAVTNDGVKSILKSGKSRSRFSELSNYVDICISAAFVWYGHWFIALMLLLSVVLMENAWDQVIELRKEMVK